MRFKLTLSSDTFAKEQSHSFQTFEVAFWMYSSFITITFINVNIPFGDRPQSINR